MPATCIKHQPSTHDNSTSMAPIDDAIAAIDARDSEDDSTLTEIADKFGVDRSTLGRKCKGTTTTQEAGYALQQKLNPQQEIRARRLYRGVNKACASTYKSHDT
jgi:AraC-like DNA-binding protein